MVQYAERATDVAIIGAGGAGLFAAMYADDNTPDDLDVTVVVKKLAGKSGCTRMVQGGYNAVLHPDDSIEDHYVDTIEGGKWINDQELAWTLVENAPKVIRKLENDLGVFFDRDEDGNIHQKPFAGQSFDRTVHKGDLTGIEIMTKIRDELLTRDVTFLEETRAVDLLTRDGEVVGVVVLDMRSGEFEVITAKAVVLATGAGATMYRISTPALEKSADGQAMAYRRDAPLQDMEMMQFHPTGLLAGDTKLTGGVIEEGIRGEGAHLYNAEDERFMEKYAPEEMERATRDIVSRASYQEIIDGRGTERGGVLLDATHLGTEFVEETFPGMTERTRNVGQDLSTQRVEVSPTSHYHMGGVTIDSDCGTELPGLFVAGEDAGGAHGANRLGGNGVVDSTVLGKQAGEAVADYVEDRPRPSYDSEQVERVIERVTAPLDREDGADVYDLRDELEDVMWEHVGVVRTGEKLDTGIERICGIRDALDDVAVSGTRRYNLEWNEYMDLENLSLIAETVARSARYRTESRGAHYRDDYPERDDDEWIANVYVRRTDDGMELWKENAAFSRTHPNDVEDALVTVSDADDRRAKSD
ncbi:FAD-binding protein [Natrialbaceae archaeon AArc-T1-2]|uniref:FAD-binding protein n=1 Tax=Natrialbaceae archaeon AArc-T1-2 TaxID=3053904 RepID=UPI00255A972C|nr:FAD-binding protein [Natrialbaceae archaeon AArc-T1-2]WIV67032.1 FAD-dependent oxidoreductase [Natrialbaceae archaeon AArc-T1-2]